jgi:hypothetical protein
MTFLRQSRTSQQLFQEIRPKSKCGRLAGRRRCFDGCGPVDRFLRRLNGLRQWCISQEKPGEKP